MQFNSARFVVFFLLFFVAHAVVTSLGSRSARLGLILAASAIFYAGWDYRYLPLLFATIAIDYSLAHAISRTESPSKKRALLVTSIVMNLGVLAAFKYTGFFLENLQAGLGAFGIAAPISVVEIVLPVGISFYTFQSMSYTIDVYRKEVEPVESWSAFTGSVAFFPHLVAGPIIRAKDLVPQMDNGPQVSWSLARRGFLLVGLGAFKKTVADLLAPIADQVFSTPAPGLVEAWTGALAFTGQIYGDFAGYTDIAIGLANILGYRFAPNFRLPYFATSPSDFWRRWHISLSSWLRDYLYISLGGNRRRLYRNLIITMGLGGLWHGAKWTFVVWGLYHGSLLVLERLIATRRTGQRARNRLPQILLMFYLTVIGWVFFRGASISEAFALLGSMHAGALSQLSWELSSRLALVVVAIIGMHLVDALAIRWGDKLSFLMIVAIAVPALLFAFIFSGSDYAFIYFQF